MLLCRHEAWQVFVGRQLQPRYHTVEHAGSYEQLLHVCNPSPVIHTHPRLTLNPRFNDATAWLDAFTRDPASSTNDGPPSLWSSIDVNADLKAAVAACVGQSSSGNCACSGTSCSSNPRFTGAIGTWDVSEVTSTKTLFETPGSGSCSIYCDFNGDISAWDTSSVTTMDGMYVWRSLLVLMPEGRCHLSASIRR